MEHKATRPWFDEQQCCIVAPFDVCSSVPDADSSLALPLDNEGVLCALETHLRVNGHGARRGQKDERNFIADGGLSSSDELSSDSLALY